MTLTDAPLREFAFTQADFERVRTLIYSRAGIALAPAKQNMVYSRLSRRLRATGIDSFHRYLDLLERGDHSEWEAFTNSLTTNLTSFFREAHHFPILAEHLRSGRFGSPALVWCAASSTGEEPYSIAMAACEAYGSLNPPVRILASDIDTQVLAKARAGVYSAEQVNDLSAERQRRFFVSANGAQAGDLQIRPEVAALIEFKQINLLGSAWPRLANVAAVFCRNVLIYFDKPSQHRVVERFHSVLHRDGLLIVGHSESLTFAADMYRLRGKTVYDVIDRRKGSVAR